MTTLRITQTELARRADVSVATLRVLQHGTGQRRTTDATLAAVSRALGWPERHLLQILLQRPPADVNPEPHSVAPPAGGDVSASTGPADILTVLRRIEGHVAAIAGHLATPPE
ncbi:helix-turn-helix domain-containing protein [Pseudofrankia asymbiotica]|nr:helix-turn-helix transcriptional regulator [Pseudofrankia asymbiotica]